MYIYIIFCIFVYPNLYLPTRIKNKNRSGTYTRVEHNKGLKFPQSDIIELLKSTGGVENKY